MGPWEPDEMKMVELNIAKQFSCLCMWFCVWYHDRKVASLLLQRSYPYTVYWVWSFTYKRTLPGIIDRSQSKHLLSQCFSHTHVCQKHAQTQTFTRSVFLLWLAAIFGVSQHLRDEIRDQPQHDITGSGRKGEGCGVIREFQASYGGFVLS